MVALEDMSVDTSNSYAICKILQKMPEQALQLIISLVLLRLMNPIPIVRHFYQNVSAPIFDHIIAT